MGRYETLNDASKDVVNCLLPGIAANFEVAEVADVIPQDIRMRIWDCDRREHVIDKSENDARNWGLSFLKELITISRIKQGKLNEFQEDLRKKVEKHEPIHPWAKLQDIKDIKEDYEALSRPRRESTPPDKALMRYDGSSTDSYLEELVEMEPTQSKKRGRPKFSHKQEVYESRLQKSKHRKYVMNPPKRLRRSSSAGWERPENSHGRRSLHVHTPSDQGDSVKSSIDFNYDNGEFNDMSLDELELQLQVAEAELKTARLRVKVNEARRKSATASVDRDVIANREGNIE